MLQLAHAILKVSWFMGFILTFFDARQRSASKGLPAHFFKFVDRDQEKGCSITAYSAARLRNIHD